MKSIKINCDEYINKIDDSQMEHIWSADLIAKAYKDGAYQVIYDILNAGPRNFETLKMICNNMRTDNFKSFSEDHSE